ncbi:transporter substrate-binding domain-containing protein [Niveibacterium sp. SC-1]|uniref:transporter substrate-binding domain-containing protein n=1 Tax=Niveibacterium sp. SC-1 TaxID=3135646 RepID=UPI00311F81CC
MRRENPTGVTASARCVFVVYRRSGGSAQWDGQRFGGLDGGAVGAQAGFSHVERLKQMGMKVDDSARSPGQLLAMLAAGRFDAAVVELGQAADARTAQPDLRVEPLPVPFEQTDLYLMVSRQVWLQRQALVERFWASIRARRERDEGR